MHPLPALCPEGGHFGHLLESLIIWGFGIALTHSHLFTFHFSLTKSFFSFLSASLDPLISGLVSNEAHLALISPSRSFFITFAIVFGAILCLFMTLIAHFRQSIQSCLPHPIILSKLCLKFSCWILYLSLTPSKTGPKLFLCTRYPCVLNKLKH